ncbi:hypothetical protein [Bacillus badius]|uniref:hypothetical protein n=1 Tax=Bacillus badius TaxID=1455 RepID=UPI000597565F|nr:hypothetical protein [Bacillus badius]KIL74379.1 hypothetical protein SD78_1448 [Bacillus badius]
MKDKKLQSRVEEFKEKGTLLVCDTIANIEAIEKYLISEGLYFETKFENGCTRFLKSDIPPY